MSLNDLTLLLLTRNHENFIEECISSINREFGNEVKILNIDIGSLDNSHRISQNLCKKFNLNAKHIQLHKDTKTLTALKSLEKYITTNYVILLSSDDVLGKKYGDVLVKLLKNCTSDTVINFPSLVTDENLNHLYMRLPNWTRSIEKNVKRLSYSNPGTAPGAVIPWRALINTESWKKPPNIVIEDYWIWWQLASFVPFIEAEECHVFYRQHQHNISNASKNKEYAYSLGYVSALPTCRTNRNINRLLSLTLIPRWLRHLNISVWRNFLSGYQDSKRSELIR